ncbi:hypothetical protein FXV83_06350 [Bradyrhizobium hipponense]|uniref:FTP domain-containing protein n=1 Tax=Bradyrhizobium hipponense TaxID=2605638 RepID=A0A5S4YS69_9BRAD|nr:hypothetical protein [Bradyrhizobium hipponense]TYO67236.1 hypothetical protein FXV83_06350 [Bradyrhizobium hipponense]
MILPQEPDLSIERDAHGTIRELRHLQTPAIAEPGQSAKRAALAYLNEAALERGLLPLEQGDWDHLSDTVESDEPRRAGKSRFRWAPVRELKRNSEIETTIVWCQQTAPLEQNAEFVPDALGHSIRLVIHHRGQTPQITSARLTTIEHAHLSIASDRVERAFGRLDGRWADNLPADMVVGLLAPLLGLPVSTARIEDATLVAYLRNERSAVYGGILGLAINATVFLPVASGDSIPHRVLFDPLENEIVRKAPIASACAGYAFASDPDSRTGAFELRPDTCADLLDHEREPVGLLGLVHVPGGRRKLSGPRVRVLTPAALGKDYDPPQQRAPFAFSSRTNEFAAVSAYYHCDSMMQLVEQFGFVLADYFGKVALPLTVEHRAKMLTGSGARDGRGINAYVTPFRADQLAPSWDVRMLFGLADFADTWKNPLGLAADVRFVWHEFCHVLILAATGSTEFDFAHSAGDALAAINGDPSSKLPAPYRGVTFPFIQLPLRRHDRKVEDGWGWNGTQYERPNPTYGLRDPAGYNAEQILSSTLFRLYCALGGDALSRNDTGQCQPDIERRRAAAYHCTYLILRAIASLGLVDTEPTSEAGQFATALMEADVGTPDLDYEGSKRRGGMLHKVIRWAFEQQGLYQLAPGGCRNEPGRPPAIDVYVDDGRAGSYGYTDGWHALPQVLWVCNGADCGAPGEPPRSGYVNYVYVKLGNRGDQPAIAASVDIFAAIGDATETWDVARGGWQKLQGNYQPQDVHPGEMVKFGPFEWTPQAGVRNALLVRATVAGDRSNIDDDCTLPCAVGPMLLAELIRTDNNLGYRDWTLQ